MGTVGAVGSWRWGCWCGEPRPTVFIAHVPRRFLDVISDRLEIVQKGNQLGFGLHLGQRERDNMALQVHGERAHELGFACARRSIQEEIELALDPRDGVCTLLALELIDERVAGDAQDAILY